jgi:3-isopropylmalate dehydrogenase
MTPGRVVALPGDGVGPEVIDEAERLLTLVAPDLSLERHPFGGSAIDHCGDPLPPETLAAARDADAVLLGAVGGPKWEGGARRPEEGLIGIRSELGVYANLRPARYGKVDLLIVRELLGGLYYGESGVRADGTVYDTLEYHPDEVARVARRAFELARGRRGRLVSVDKANVISTSRMWRQVVTEVGREFPDVELTHALADSTAMRIVTHPETFDTLVMENTFGDILSDVAAGVAGGLGIAASASLGDNGPAVYEPVHGSAPDIAGKGIANPAAMLRSVAMMLRYSFGNAALADSVDEAVDAALLATPTPDLGGSHSTTDVTDHVLATLRTHQLEEVR